MQHQVQESAGKEDDFHRRIFERDNEIKALRSELVNLKESEEHLRQLVQVKQTEAEELTEDIQTLAKENKYVN
jgi:predicted RNase H-like nuclease (RuvC/YqgF family)